MSRPGERGSALIEITVIGFLTALLVFQIALGAARIQASGELATEAAQVAAFHAARHGDLEGARLLANRFAPAEIQVFRTGDSVSAVVTLDVEVLGPQGWLRRRVTGRATAQISPYRSNRDG